MGFFCPAGTKFGYQYPCPPGTYNNVTNATSSAKCLPMPKGYFSNEWGVS